MGKWINMFWPLHVINNTQYDWRTVRANDIISVSSESVGKNKVQCYIYSEWLLCVAAKEKKRECGHKTFVPIIPP